MKLERIPTRRQPVKTTLHARFFNKTKPRKQRAAAAAAAPIEEVEGSRINISRSLSIIFLIHIIAIGMIFVHKQYLSGRTPVPEAADSSAVKKPSQAAASGNKETSNLSDGAKPYMVKKGDNYAIIAEKFNVDESELRNTNPGVDIRSGVVLRIPKGKRIVAEVPPEVAALSQNNPPNDSERGLVEILPSGDTGSTKLVRPQNQVYSQDVSGRTHLVKAGENIWRISNQYKVDQKKLLEINNITDPSKLKIGQVLKLP